MTKINIDDYVKVNIAIDLVLPIDYWYVALLLCCLDPMQSVGRNELP